ncbi:MAG TPA: hypothetical protein DCF62_03015 [Porticoccaceae bacterium]|nr:hypothetical protein [Porticoccaceae bacterium]
MISLLETTQWLVAGGFGSQPTLGKVSLSNGTGYETIGLYVPMSQFLANLIPLVENPHLTSHATLVELTLSDNGVLLSLQQTGLQGKTTLRRLEGKTLLINPITDLNFERFPVNIYSDDDDVIERISALPGINMLSVKPKKDYQIDSPDNSHAYNLIDCRQHNTGVSCPAPPGMNSLYLHALNKALTESNTGHSLYWPFFDTDLYCALTRLHKTSPMLILLAEDSKPSQLTTQVILEKLGHTVICADDGVEALQLARQTRFDLIFLDERMPGLNGSNVAATLNQKDEINASTHKISLTGITDQKFLSGLFSVGISDYLEKPVNKKRIEVMLSKFNRANQPLRLSEIEKQENQS